MPHTTLINTDIDTLVNSLKRGSVALFIGPHALTDAAGQSLQAQQLQYLQARLDAESYSFYADDELFYFNNNNTKAKAKAHLKTFYESASADTQLAAQLADLPFPMIVSATLDPYFIGTLRTVCPAATTDFYDPSRNPAPLGSPTVQQPLYYQIFGSLRENNSILLTHDDLFRYIAAIMGDKKLHTDFKNALDGITNFIFLGFKFEKWYVQLLLRLLEVNTREVVRTATHEGNTDETIALCTDQFSIDFVNKNIEEFAHELYTACAKNNLLRSQQAAAQIDTQLLSLQLTALLEQNNLPEVIDKMKVFFNEIGDTELQDAISLFASRYNRWRRDSDEGVLENAETAYNKLIKTAKNYINEIKELGS